MPSRGSVGQRSVPAWPARRSSSISSGRLGHADSACLGGATASPLAGAGSTDGIPNVAGDDCINAPEVDLPERASGPLRIAVSRSRPPEQAQWLVAEAGAELVPMGSAGYKALAVLLGEADAYVHAGGQYEWDSAAPVAVARAAGLHTSRVDGSELRYNQPDPRLPDLIVARPEVAEPILAITVR